MELRTRWSVERVRALGVTTDLVTAAAALGIGRTTAYTLARAGRFPVPVMKAGARYLVGVGHLLQAVGVESDRPAGLDPHPGPPRIPVDHDPQIPPTASPRITPPHEQDRP
jgi:hypothetical protein